MSRKISFWLVCGVLAVNLLVPGQGNAAEPPAPEASQAEVILQDLAVETEDGAAAPGICADEEETFTLEDLQQTLGARNVCGIPCGSLVYPPVNCTFACGDAARCYHGYCIYW